ncbi:MAG TPA: glycosyltransferase, partial [Ktedonobacteraceae bacterium]|nr:glycosyltransferase [Ktedonobacteraceae bacterium]
SALPDLLPSCSVLQITGKKLFEETRTQAEQTMEGMDDETRQRYKLVAYLNEEMPLALQASTIVLCRAGAATLSELAVLGKPGILVPLPPAIGSSPQEANAAMFGRKGAAYVIKDLDLKREVVVERIINSISSKDELTAMAEAALAFAMPDATQAIAAEVVKIATMRGARVTRHESLVV